MVASVRWASVQHAGRRSRTSRRCIRAKVAKGRYIPSSFARARAQRLTDTNRTTGAHRNVCASTGHTVVRNPRCHTVATNPACLREVARSPSRERRRGSVKMRKGRRPALCLICNPLESGSHLHLLRQHQEHQ